jgi:hypothetical protein
MDAVLRGYSALGSNVVEGSWMRVAPRQRHERHVENSHLLAVPIKEASHYLI